MTKKNKIDWTLDKQLFLLVIGIGLLMLFLSGIQFFYQRQFCLNQGHENITDWEVIYDAKEKVDSTFFECDGKYRFEKYYNPFNYTDKWGNTLINRSYTIRQLK